VFSQGIFSGFHKGPGRRKSGLLVPALRKLPAVPDYYLLWFEMLFPSWYSLIVINIRLNRQICSMGLVCVSIVENFLEIGTVKYVGFLIVDRSIGGLVDGSIVSSTPLPSTPLRQRRHGRNFMKPQSIFRSHQTPIITSSNHNKLTCYPIFRKIYLLNPPNPRSILIGRGYFDILRQAQ